MRPPLKLSGIDQEHLQELYDSAKVARDELPYSPSFDELCQGFQDRTFKNAHPEQIYAALLKYVRSSTNSAGEVAAVSLTEDQLKQLKGLLPRHAKGAKMLPYSDEFEAAQKEFNKHANTNLEPGDFWRAILRSQGPKRRPPKRAKVTAPAAESEDDDIE
jgi:SOS-response transcriptional repressor LexA